MTDHADSYYAQTLADNRVRPSLKGPVEADVCVIGGGLAGLATALGLAERGKTVVVLEGRRIGWGASGRNGGFVLAGYPTGFGNIARKTGIDNARALFNLTRDAQKLIRERVCAYGINCDLVDGHMRTSWYDDAAAVRTDVEAMKELGVPAEFLPREDVRRMCVTDKYYDAILYPDYFHMHPLNYMAGIASAFEEKGGHIYEDTMAERLESGPVGEHTVETAQGSVTARHVVYCGSAYFNGLDKKLDRSCLPISTYVVTTAPLSKEQAESAIRVPYAIRDTRWTDDYYRLLPDNSLLWGGRVGLGKQVPDNLKGAIYSDIVKIYPQLAGIEIRKAWAGIMGYTVHRMPHIGQMDQGIWCCTNFGGNGVGPTTAGGEVIASAIAENDERYKLFSPFGFAYTGGVLGPYVAQAVYHSWTVRDWIENLRYKMKTGDRKAA